MSDLINCPLQDSWFLEVLPQNFPWKLFFPWISVSGMTSPWWGLVGMQRSLVLIWLQVLLLCRDKMLIILIWEQTLDKYWCMKNISVHPPLCHVFKHMTVRNQPHLPKTLWMDGCQPTAPMVNKNCLENRATKATSYMESEHHAVNGGNGNMCNCIPTQDHLKANSCRCVWLQGSLQCSFLT